MKTAIVAVLLAFFLTPSPNASAAFDKPMLWNGTYETAAAACAYLVTISPGMAGYSFHQDRFAGSGPNSTQDCFGMMSSGIGPVYYANTGRSEGPCPTNSTFTSGQCHCNSGYSEVGSTCIIPPNPCPEDRTVPSSTGYYDYGTSPPTVTKSPPSTIPKLACAGSKLMTFIGPTDGTPASSYKRALVNGVAHYYVLASYEYMCGFTGNHEGCTSGETTPVSELTTPPADTCPGAHVLGLINGKTVCYGADGVPLNPNTTNTADTTQSTTANPDGTKTVTRTNADGSVTTSIFNADGSLQSESITPPIDPSPESEFCKKKPQDPLCSRGEFAGSCDGSFTCSGDAIQCAQAREAAMLRCEMVKRNAVTSLGESLIAGVDPDQSSLPSPSSPTLINVSGSIVTTGFLSAASCPADQVFIVAGNSFVIPWTRLCGIFQMLGYVLMIIASIASARIVLGSKS